MGGIATLPELLDELNECCSEQVGKDCLILDALTNPNCPVPLAETLDKEGGVLNLTGDVTANYTAGQTISLKDANGNICGSATVAEGGSTFTPGEDGAVGTTAVAIEECDLQDGKTPANIATAQVMLQTSVKAVKAVVAKTSIRTLAKRVAVKVAEEVKTEATTTVRRTASRSRSAS